jgi:hypothetical protein
MKKTIGLSIVFALIVPLQAEATTASYTVDALSNATGRGSGVPVSVFAGESFSVSVDPLDLWSAGPLPRWSNANGITGPDLIATGLPDVNGDDPGVPAGTVIGSSIFPLAPANGLTAPYGTLVGQWGAGNYFVVGTAYTGVALDSTLKLFYLDGLYSDNTGSVLATVTTTPVPEPEAYAMFMLGLGLLGFMTLRRTSS